ncbi:hypothetical protein K438DRAFT_1996397 [Mycena galopus ATCC 62051]|nr:hypothetical protein K438DRAFT_1996397 [Mycena galopus ATCC 62051]
MSSQSTPSLLLDLAAELRLQIYDAVLDLPLDCKVARWKPSKQPAQTVPARLPIPWLSLMLVCKEIANELEHHIHASGNTTYELEVDNLQSRRSIAGKVTWRQIPCPPSSARTLQAAVTFTSNTRFWGDGGPMPILSELYQVLNCFIHNGPMLSRRSPLDKHIHLDALILQICVMEPDPDQRGRGRNHAQAMMLERKKQLRRDLGQYISEIVDRGVLFGAVDKIVCLSADDDGDEKAIEWDVCWKTIGDMTEWNRYNFFWGVSGSSSLEASS